MDAETRRLLDRLAQDWSVSRSEALRRAIRQTAGTEFASNRLAALDLLQKRAAMTAAKASQWVEDVNNERKAGRVHGEG
ncbi:MAG: ribbon-helix-helix protein, CopG family [Burkholderiaceae bacterium]